MTVFKKIFTSAAVFLTVFIIISVISGVYYHYQLSHQEPEKDGWTCRCDFRVFWSAGHRLNNYAFSPAAKAPSGYEKALDEYLDGNSTRLYDRSETFYHFRYSPVTAFFMIPFALIAYPAHALAVWFIVISIALLASLILLVRQASSDFNISRGMRYAMLWTAFIASLRFYFMGLSVGQCDVFIAFFFVLFLMCHLRGREILCGLILALIIQFKPLFSPMLLYFLFTGKKKLVLSALIGTAALLSAPAAVIGPGKAWALLKDWIGILDMSVPSQILNYKNQSITYFIGKTLIDIKAVGPSISVENLFYTISGVLTVSAYAALVLFGRSLKAYGDKKFKYLEASVLIITALLFSPLVWISHFISLVIPVCTAILFFPAVRNKPPMYAALGCFAAFSIIAGTDITRFIPVFNEGHFINIALGAVFLTYGLVYSYVRQDGRGG